MDTTRVLVVDDNAPFRTGLRALLSSVPELSLVGEPPAVRRQSSLPSGCSPTSSSWTSPCPG